MDRLMQIATDARLGVEGTARRGLHRAPLGLSACPTLQMPHATPWSHENSMDVHISFYIALSWPVICLGVLKHQCTKLPIVFWLQRDIEPADYYQSLTRYVVIKSNGLTETHPAGRYRNWINVVLADFGDTLARMFLSHFKSSTASS